MGLIKDFPHAFGAFLKTEQAIGCLRIQKGIAGGGVRDGSRGGVGVRRGERQGEGAQAGWVRLKAGPRAEGRQGGCRPLARRQALGGERLRLGGYAPTDAAHCREEGALYLYLCLCPAQRHPARHGWGI